MGIKYKVNEAFFDTWSPTMAYVLGYWYADGSLEDAYYLRGKYIRVTSTDKSTVYKIRRWFESKHTIVVILPSEKHPGKTRYSLRIGSHKLYNRLIALGLYPNKSLTIGFPKIPKEMAAHFIRGYLDGDGCVSLWRTKGKTGKLIMRKLSVIFTSGSKKFLRGLSEEIAQNTSVKKKRICDSDRAYQLRYGTKDSIVLFHFLYADCPKELCLLRKVKKFKKYFTLRSTKSNIHTVKILKEITS